MQISQDKGKDDGEITAYLGRRAKVIEQSILEYLTKASSDRYIKTLLGRSGFVLDGEAVSKSIIEPALYLLGAGGKRWRPALMLLVLESLGKDPNNFAEFSIVPEIIHNATLVHDDIEDGAVKRRNIDCVHIKYGVDIAVNLADFMYYFPVVAIMDSKKIPANVKYKLIDVQERENLRVSIGQAVDIAWHNALVNPLTITEDNYLQMVYDKTGALARMAAKFGGILGGANDDLIEKLGKFGATIGVAFQIQDDLLNITESGVSKTKGGTGEDITEGKITLMVIHALHNVSKKEQRRLVEILKMHTKDRRRIDEAIGIILKPNTEEYVRRLQVNLVTDAWNGIESSLKPSEAKNKLKEFAEFLASRKF